MCSDADLGVVHKGFGGILLGLCEGLVLGKL